jgi:hypothetical protein
MSGEMGRVVDPLETCRGLRTDRHDPVEDARRRGGSGREESRDDEDEKRNPSHGGRLPREGIPRPTTGSTGRKSRDRLGAHFGHPPPPVDAPPRRMLCLECRRGIPCPL